MRLKDPDLIELHEWFEDALSRITKFGRQEKMRLRRKIRDEIYLLLTYENPTPSGIFNRWEERLSDVFLAFPFGLKEDLYRLLVKKMEHPKW